MTYHAIIKVFFFLLGVNFKRISEDPTPEQLTKSVTARIIKASKFKAISQYFA